MRGRSKLRPPRPERQPTEKLSALKSSGSLSTRRAWGPATAWVSAGLVLVLTWPVESMQLPPGLDPSHRAGMHMSARLGFEFGDDLAYTYGPLGFLTSPVLYYVRTAVAALLFTVLTTGAVLVVVSRRVGRRWSPVPTFVATLVAGLAVMVMIRSQGHADLASLLVVLLAADWVYREDRAGDSVMPVLMAAMSAFAVIVKFSGGAIGLMVLAGACLARSVRRRGQGPLIDVARFIRLGALSLAGFVVSLALFWLLAGQRLGTLPAFLVLAKEFTAGYTDAMSYEDPRRRWEYPVAAMVVLAMVILAVRSAPDDAGPRRYALLALVALPLFPLFKQGFVRHDSHSLYFFAGVAVLSTVLWAHGSTVATMALLSAASLTTFAVVAVGLDGVGGILTGGPARALRTVEELAAARTIQSANREALRSSYPFSPGHLDLLSGHSLHVDPVEATIAWAVPGIRWRPAPVFQSYAAFTDDLDRLNASFLASPEAPDFILRQFTAIDGRNPQFESPRYVMEMMCRYREVGHESSWQTLRRGDNRCGTRAVLDAREVRFGEWVGVPRPSAPDRMLVARVVGVRRPATSVVRSLLYKAPEHYLESTHGQRYRFVLGHASEPHVLHVPACLQWSPIFLDPAVYDELRLTVGQSGGGAGAYRVEFSEVQFRCPPPAVDPAA